MKGYQRELIDLAIERGVLRLGHFILKSGRESPYFFNPGLFNTGAALAALGRIYAQAIVDWGLPFDLLFGPAYKGIPLVSAVAVALAEGHGRDLPYAFNRKEAKAHGEGGLVVGGPIAGRVLIVDDVLTAGTSVRESCHLIRSLGGEPAGACIALDRQERGLGGASAVAEVEGALGLPVRSVVALDDLIVYLGEHPGLGEALAEVRAYRARYGA